MEKHLKISIKIIPVILLVSFFLFSGTCNESTPTENTAGKIVKETPSPTITQNWEPVTEIPYDMVVSTDIVRELGYMFTRSRSRKAYVMVKPGMNPLTYSPTREDEEAILAADVFLYMGLDLEPWLEPILEKVKDKVRCIPLAAGLEKELLIPSDKYPGGYDPHIWWGQDVWEKFLLIVVKNLVLVDPEGEYTYASVYLRYGEATNLLNLRYFKMWMGAIPEERRFLITLHPAYSYFGRCYDFTVRSILEPGQDNYSPERINELADFIIANKIPVIFPETTYSRKPMEELQAAVEAKGHSVAIGPELYSYFLEQEQDNPNYTYLRAARSMGRKIYDALKTEDSPGMPD